MRLLTASLACLLAAVALADRAMVPENVSPTGIAAPDGRVAVMGDRFVVCEKTPQGADLRSYDGSGANPEVVHTFTAVPDAWWLAPNGMHVAWNAGGKLHVSSIGGPDREVGKAAPGVVAWSANGTRFAFLRDRQIVTGLCAGGAPLEIAPRHNSVPMSDPVLSGDGKRVYILTSPVNDDARDSVVGTPDAIDRADLAAAAPAFEQILCDRGVTFSTLASSGALPVEDKLKHSADWPDRLAWLAGKDGRTEVRMLDVETGKAETLEKDDSLESVTWSPSGKSVIVTGRAKNGRVKAWSIETFRSGTMQCFNGDPLASLEGNDLSGPVSTADGAVFLVARPADDKGAPKVIRAGR